jgi:membrane protein
MTPREMEMLEAQIRDVINRHIARGRLTVRVSLHAGADKLSARLHLNLPLAKAYARELARLSKQLKLSGPVTLDHLVRAGARYTERHGNDYGAAVTYFSVLSLVPITMVAFAAAGFALRARPGAVDRLKDEITGAWPGALGDTLNSVINQAISSATTVGFFGLLVALYSGIGWMTNLRTALSEQWGQVPTPPPIVKRVLFDLLTLLGLGLALAVTFAVTGLLSGFAGTVLTFLGLAEQTWAKALLTLLGVLIGLAANWLIFAWVLARLPREQVALRSVAKAAVLGAVGFEVLKQGMAIYLQTITRTPSGAVFGSTLGLLVFIYYASRFVLFVTAWAATSRENQSREPVAVPGPAVIHSEVVVAQRPSGAAVAGLLGAGAVTGLLGARLIRRR